MPSNHLVPCHPLLLMSSIFPRIRVFSIESAFGIKWSKYWSFSFSNSTCSDYSELISFRIDCFALQPKRLSRVLFSTIIQKHQFFGSQPSLRQFLTNIRKYWCHKCNIIILYMTILFSLYTDQASEIQVTMMLTESCKLRGLHHR